MSSTVSQSVIQSSCCRKIFTLLYVFNCSGGKVCLNAMINGSLFEQRQRTWCAKTLVPYIYDEYRSKNSCRCCTQIHLRQWLKFISTPMFVAVPLCTRQTTATMLPGAATHTCPNVMTALKLQCHDITATSSLFMLIFFWQIV